MAILKCKMCGGDIILSEDKTFGTCDSCGSTMTFPKVSDEHKLNLYNRANHFRRQNEFDKAIAAYDKILDQDDTDAEAHWGAVLSRYGIEYVEDPATHERIPTCHRVQAASILSDPDYLSALEYAPDTASRDIYEQEARRIAEIQKGILAISSQEKPYDVFICYKETDEAGQRTRDSALAQEIYYQLTNEGYKVFFSRITLEDKLGQEYEPYIFAALSSARVMLVIGTKPEFFNAVWVKNEWSRYLALMKQDRTRLLIPCYRDMDPYDLPEELSALQSQDMSKIGFVQDLIRGIKKITAKDENKTKTVPQIVTAAGANIENLMKRAWLFMEDGDFTSANEYLDKVLDEDAEYAPAYIGKVCTALGFRKEEQLAEAKFLYAEHPDWKKAMRFATPQQKVTYEEYYEQVKARVARQIRDFAYDCAMEIAVNPNANQEELEQAKEQYRIACNSFGSGRADGSRWKRGAENEAQFQKAVVEKDPGDVMEDNYRIAAEMFQVIGDDEATLRVKECFALAELARMKVIYDLTDNKSRQNRSAVEWDELANIFLSIHEYKDAKARAQDCQDRAESERNCLYEEAINAMKEAGDESYKWKRVQYKFSDTNLNDYRDVEELRKKVDQRCKECILIEEKKSKAAAARKKRNKILGVLAAVLVIAAVLVAILVIIPGNNYRNAVALKQAGRYEEAITAFEALNGYSDSVAQIEACQSSIKEREYHAAVALQQAGKYEEAIIAFTALGSYKDSATYITEIKYMQAKALAASGDYASAYALYATITGYKDVDSIISTDNNIAAIARETKLAACKNVGSFVNFGTYPQTAEGKDNTPIEWLVLDYDAASNHTLLISRYGLDVKKYNEKEEDTTWENCTLRAWLNADFYSKAFNASEQSAILLTDVDNSSQGANGLKGENNTQDRLFLLSYPEAYKYFDVTSKNKSNYKSRIAPTSYMATQHTYTSDSSEKTNDGDESWPWWLRSQPAQQSEALLIESDGGLYKGDITFKLLVRPAFWLDLNEDIF